MSEIPIVVLSDFPGAEVIAQICKDNLIPVLSEGDRIELGKLDEFAGKQMLCFGCDYPEWPSKIVYKDSRIENGSSPHDHFDFSFIGHFFRYFKITDQADERVYASSVAQIYPSRGWRESFKQFSKSDYRSYMLSYLAKKMDSSVDDLAEYLDSQEEAINSGQFVSRVYDHRHAVPDWSVIQACYQAESAIMYLNEDGALVLDGPCGENGFMWFRMFCKNSGYEIIKENTAREIAVAKIK